MEPKIVLTLARSDAEALVVSLRRRFERLCDIRKELCEPDEFDELEREERAYFDAENALVERIIGVLAQALEEDPRH
ncbi:hypothetical protein IY145_20365 [Methylosinus sp. H3A]|uniref:hypothetical protein n=1 Tax=Methylosinus sp. H3A TaxID=2785786 RepID=UPI0018C33612|nr:hypothetical protein [Methylosinus sp. H3A]MBG0811710.1 hypothetical protein [Methylosinus sp. H3A]